MRVASVVFEGDQRVAVCGDGENWQLIDARKHPAVQSVKALISGVHQAKSVLAGAADVDVNDLRFMTPIASPEKIICVGKNYEQHAQEMGSEKPELPVIFNKLASCLIADSESIELPCISNKVDYEGELVVVIGQSGRNIERERAMEHVFGYTIGNDVTARDWQKGRPGGQWLLGKSFDTFAPVGPWIVTAEAVNDPQNLLIELTLNDQVMQSARTSDMIFPIDYLISHISKFFTLKAGDLLFTGTPAGVGAGRDPEVYLKSSDQVTVSIEGIGKLSNTVVMASQ